MSKALDNLEIDEMFIRAAKSKASLEERTYELEQERVDDNPDLKDEYWQFLSKNRYAAFDKQLIYERILMYINHFRMYIKEMEKANGTD